MKTLYFLLGLLLPLAIAFLSILLDIVYFPLILIPDELYYGMKIVLVFLLLWDGWLIQEVRNHVYIKV